ncbi:MAG: hypothetical protein ACO3CX_06565, partial [Ilumatobacteraceae bacterium]
ESDKNDGGNGNGGNGGNGDPGLPPLPGTDDNDDGIPEPWPTPGEPRNRPGSPCSGCVQVFPYQSGDDNKSPKVTKSPANTSIGTIRVTTADGGEVTIGGTTASGQPATSTTETGGLLVGADGIVPISLSNLTPGSTVTIWLADQFSVSATVMPDGSVVLSAPIPDDLASGTYAGRVDFTDAAGNPQTILFGFEWQSNESSLFGFDGTLANGLGAIGFVVFVGLVSLAVLRRRSSKALSKKQASEQVDGN